MYLLILRFKYITYGGFLFALVFLQCIDRSFGTVKVIDSSLFPHRSKSVFRISLSPLPSNYPIHTSVRLEINNNQNNLLSKATMMLGVSNRMENQIRDRFMRIENWYLDTSRQLHIKMKFYPPANNLIMKIRYAEARTMDQRLSIMNRMSDNDVIYTKKVKLIVDPKLEFSISTRDGNTQGVNDKDIAVVTCKARGGIPSQAPKVTIERSIEQSSHDLDIDSNKVTVKFIAKLEDHRKVIKCIAGNVRKTLFINVFHHPTALKFYPGKYNTVENGSSVICSSVNGFPKPTVEWIFISGPRNASYYHKIKKNNLTMLKNAPMGSQWVFNCSVTNNIPQSYDKGVVESLSFIIAPKSKVATIVISLVVILVVLLLLAALVWYKGHSLRQWFVRKRGSSEQQMEEEPTNNNLRSMYDYPVVQGNDIEGKEEGKKSKKGRKKVKEKEKMDDSNMSALI